MQCRAPLWRTVTFVLLACVSNCLRLHHEDAFHAVRAMHYRIPEDFGVQHHQILGETGEGVPGMLHVIIKAIRKDQTVLIWGTGVFEPLQADTTCRSPASFEKAPPTFTLEGRQPWPVTLHLPANQPGVPFHLHVEVQDPSHSFALKIQGWPRFAMIRPVVSEEVLSPIDASIAGPPVHTINSTNQGFNRAMAPIVGVISPMHVNRPFQLHEFPALVSHHVQYHLRLGYSLFVMYVRPPLEVAMANNTIIKELVKRNRLLLISWNSMPHHSDHPYFDQELIYNHAATLFWGHNVWFNTIDVDEFVAADTELRSVRHVISNCPPSQEGAPDLLRLVRWQMDCPDCRAHWKENESGDLLYWAQRNVPDPLKLYSRAGPYDPVFAGKYFLNPNAVACLTPHTADMLPGAGPSVEVPPSCAYIAHLVNLIHPRHTKEQDYFDKPTTWWWIKSDSELHYTRR